MACEVCECDVVVCVHTQSSGYTLDFPVAERERMRLVLCVDSKCLYCILCQLASGLVNSSHPHISIKSAEVTD